MDFPILDFAVGKPTKLVNEGVWPNPLVKVDCVGVHRVTLGDVVVHLEHPELSPPFGVVVPQAHFFHVQVDRAPHSSLVFEFTH